MRRVSFVTILLSTLVLAVIWGGWLLYGTNIVSNFQGDFQKAGVFGDSFGAITSLFSMLGFVGILITIWQQQDDQHIQRFESSFFQMLQLLRELRDEVEFRFSVEYLQEFEWEPTTSATGVEAFGRILREFNWLHSVQPIEGGVPTKASSRSSIESAYSLTVEGQRGFSVEPYFRVLYTILKRIDEDAVLTLEQKLNYGRLVRSQLTSDEIALAGINGLSFRSKNFLNFVVKFRLLKYMTAGNAVRELIAPHYPNHTFYASHEIAMYRRSLRRRGRLAN